MNKGLPIIVAAALVAMTLVAACALSACALLRSSDTPLQMPAQTGDSATANSTDTDAATAEIQEAEHLRDSKSVYKGQDDVGVKTMYLTVSTGSKADGTDHTWEQVNAHSAYWYEEKGIDKYEVEALLQVGDGGGPQKGKLGYGETEPNATVKIRGHSSSLSNLKSYKIKLKDGDGTWNGQQVINLNKHPFDGLRFRNKLGFSMLQSIPQLMSLRTQFVHLYVKDTTKGGDGTFDDYGLYTQVEELDEDALEAHGLDGRGQLYKAEDFEFHRYEDDIKLASDPGYDESAFEEHLEISGKNHDHSKLIAMLDDVNDESVPIEEVLSESFDVENLSYWLAFNLLTGNVDTQNQNFCLYSPSDSDTWYFLCWDLDGIMFYDESEIKGDNSYTSWRRGVSDYWGNTLIRRCLQSESFREYLQAAIDDLRQDELSEKSVRALAKEYRAVAKPYTYADSSKYTPLTAGQYDKVANGLPALVAFYHENYEGSLGRPMPFFIATPSVSDGQMTVNWGASYDLNGEDLSYTATLATDPGMEGTVYTYTGADTSMTLDDPGEGEYYLKVTATNASGETQDAFDTVRPGEDGERYFGEIVFAEGADGAVTRE